MADSAHSIKYAPSFVFPWMAMVIGIPITVLLFIVIQSSVEYAAQLRFEREAQTANGLIEDRLRSYSDVLYALRALFASEAPVDRLRFHRFVQSLDLKNRYPGFDSLNYAAHVPADKRKRFEHEVRHDTTFDLGGYPNFAIKPPGERPEYFVIVYLEPMIGYEFAFGLDIAANPAADNPDRLRTALHAARDSGKLTASGQPLRIKQAKGAIYLAMRLAVYRPGMALDTVERRRDAYVGSVGAGLNVENLMKAALKDRMLNNMRVRLYDAGSVEQQVSAGSPGETRVLLFDNARLTQSGFTSHASPSFDREFIYTLPVEIATRVWEFEYSAPKSSTMNLTDRFLPAAVFTGGLVCTFLVFGVLYSLASSRSRAIQLASEITRDLRESEAGLAEAQQMAHLGNWALDPKTERMTGSDETWRILGFEATLPAEFFYSDFIERVHDDDRRAVDAALRRSIESGEDIDIEHRLKADRRTVRWVQTVAHPARRDDRAFVPGTIMDITRRKLAEEELKNSAEQLQALSRRLVDAQELERRRFSRELHDLVGQNLTALSINLDILKSQVGDDGNEAMRVRLGDSAALLESTTEAIENVMSELRPPMLDDYGLLSALQWYVNDFSRRTGIDVRIDGDEHMERLAPEREIALFRIVQEALNNVAKHARASCVEVSIESRDAHCVLSVQDNGVGFESGAGSKSRRRPGLGTVTMRERAQAVGGAFAIDAASNAGTRITVRIPV